MRRSFDDLDTPLSSVTFVVLDLETTGGSAQTCAITEVGALKLRGGECLGTFQTLVNPGPDVAIPPEVTYLTGITESMVAPAPAIDSVLPALAEFIGGAVVVGHNVHFDLGFLREDLARLGYPPLGNRFVDTYALARRLVRDEVPNCKLRTLARHFRTTADPCHRALDDARATGEVLHHLLERTAALGVMALDDLLALPTTARHPQVAKLRWVAPLPRKPGVYLFRDVAGRVLYVGRATDLRRRVRSYFASDDRRRIGPLLQEAASLDHLVCVNDLEASVLQVRLVHEHRPRYNRTATAWSEYRYVKLTIGERFPRLVVARAPRSGDGCVYLGPLPSAAAARAVVDAIASAVPIRRRAADRPSVEPQEYSSFVAQVVEELTSTPSLLVDRPTEGASVLARTVLRQRRLEALVVAGRLEVELDDGGGAVVDRGRLVETWGPDGRTGTSNPALAPRPSPGADLPIAADAFDEVACIAAWLDARAAQLRIVEAEHGWSPPAARFGRFDVVPVDRAQATSSAVA